MGNGSAAAFLSYDFVTKEIKAGPTTVGSSTGDYLVWNSNHPLGGASWTVGSDAVNLGAGSAAISGTVAIGKGADAARGSHSVAVGQSAVSGTYGTAVGYGCELFLPSPHGR